MNDQHLSVDDMPLFTKLRMTAFGEAVIEIANDPACDQWSFSQMICHALEQETTARTERRVLKLLKASRTPNRPPAWNTSTTSTAETSTAT